MSDAPRRAGVVVAGAGVIGLACAWDLARRGLSVVVLDPRPMSGASGVAAGMLAPVTEVHYGEESLLRLNLAGADRYPSFVAELEETTGLNVGYRRCGTVVVARDPDENALLEDLFRFQARLGLEVERLRASECRALEPGLAPRIRGGIFVPGDHQVDPRALGRALVNACKSAGVRFVPAAARGVMLDDGRVRGIRHDNGTVSCGVVVVAAGVASNDLDGIPAAERPPLRPVKGQLIHLRGPAAEPVSDHNVRATSVYVVSRGDGRSIVGATVEERGRDTTVTAGAVYELLRDAYELLPAITEMEMTETIAGLRPATPDNAPVIGATNVEGLVYATGHYRNGILLAAVTADAVGAVVAGEQPPIDIASFYPGRFAATVTA